MFPDNLDLTSADGVNNLYNSLKIAAETGWAHIMAVQRYDGRARSGQFVKRHWRPLNTLLFNEQRHFVFLLHHVDGITEEALRESGGAPDGAPGADGR